MKRLSELDTLRGLAALSVIIGHIYLIYPFVPNYVNFSPFHIFWAASEAVILFFILSGFVLSIPFMNANYKLNYYGYILKRVCRIYIPYLIAVSLSFLLFNIFPNSGNEGLSEWFNDKWNIHSNSGSFIQHLLLLGNFQTTYINPVVWSLIHELRISLLFPIIMIAILRFNWKINLFLAGILSLCSMINMGLNFELAMGFKNSYIDSFHYLAMFIIGSLICKNVKQLTSMYNKLKTRNKVFLNIAGVLFYIYSQGIHYIFPQNYVYVIADWGVALGGSIFILSAISLSQSNKNNFLVNNKILVLNGKISYSLYLYHMPILMTFLITLKDLLPLSLIIVISFIVLYTISYLSWRYVELPAGALGRHLSNRYMKHQLNHNLKDKEVS